MRKTVRIVSFTLLVVAVGALPGRAAAAAPANATRARDVLPAEGLIPSSVAPIRNQAALDAHYYLADEAVLGLGRKADAVLARYKTGPGESLLLVVAYPSVKKTASVYARFGRDFFSGTFDPESLRAVEKIETGDWAGVSRKGRFLIVVLEAPDRAACEDLLRAAEDRIAAAPSP